MSWFADNLNPNANKTAEDQEEKEVPLTLSASYKKNPFEAAVVDLDKFEQIHLDPEALEDGKVNVITDKPTDVSK